MFNDLRVVATIVAKPGSEETVRGGLTALLEASLKEPGNVTYELFESASTRGTFVTIEVWRSQEDLESHMQTPHLQEALAVFGDHLTGPPAIHPLIPVH